VIAIKESTDLENFIELQIYVEQNRDVEGFANLLKDICEQELTVFFPNRLIELLETSKDKRITCRVRRGGPRRIFAHPNSIELKDS